MKLSDLPETKWLLVSLLIMASVFVVLDQMTMSDLQEEIDHLKASKFLSEQTVELQKKYIDSLEFHNGCIDGHGCWVDRHQECRVLKTAI